ncbi:carbohydrate-binding module family 21 protein [Athelia psychrophila]|uniref:Carbohydrate-binding module family 21 protein n=1 Tax=Athelia psychrophila TaxID=1759441 RepID=A0A166F2Z8_9AGAM|nr:carbohydrate-binding module family 21 protein [Fibularhizoctonia sp. CBS 109695]
MSYTTCAPVQVKQRTSMDYSRNSNAAGAPLPSIPRRTSSSNSSRSTHTQSASEPSLSSSSFSGSIHVPPARVVVQPPTPPHPQHAATFGSRRQEEASESESASSLSDGSQPTILRRPKRVRGRRSPPNGLVDADTSLPPTMPKLASPPGSDSASTKGRGLRQSSAQVADVASPRPSKITTPATVNTLQLNLGKPGHSRRLSESHISALSKSHADVPAVTVAASVSAAPMLRSKSGQPIKSSLKSGRRPVLSVVTRGPPSKSEPNTPTTPKSVHFDAHLEHVKLFLAEQKPLAVSRDGSPTDDTSGTESDFPSFIYGRSEEKEGKRVLAMQVTNMPKSKRMEADVALEELNLSSDLATIHGRVRVRNLAFEKWLAVRFTFDSWQTTSEVTAKYVESRNQNKYDIFGFTIRLNDILSRIEEKTLLLALRYTVAGREIWDNNGGANYLGKFTKLKVAVPKPVVLAPVAPPKMMPSDSEDEGSGRAITHLKSKLEQFAQTRDSPPAAFLTEHTKKVDSQKPPALQSMSNARYDFSASLKNNSWKGVPTPPRHIRMNTYPATSPNTIPFPQKTSPAPGKIYFGLPSPRTSAMGSPASDDNMLRQPVVATEEEHSLARRDSRNHMRGYFDRSVSENSGVKRTPVGTPLDLTPPGMTESVSARFNSFPPSNDGHRISPPVPTWSVTLAPGSEDSTPAMTSPSTSSRSSTPSPTEEYGSLTNRRAARELSSDSSPQVGDNYSSFLNRFCFYTGPEAKSTATLTVGDEIQRSHSASSVEEFLMHTPPAATFVPTFPSMVTPTRSPSFDELACRRSGSTTPTARNIVLSESRSPTPVAV